MKVTAVKVWTFLITGAILTHHYREEVILGGDLDMTIGMGGMDTIISSDYGQNNLCRQVGILIFFIRLGSKSMDK